jgi:hypothetical protein
MKRWLLPARVIALFKEHWTLIMVTFELFWLAVMLLARASEHSTLDIPEFVYVNF